jgi:hypothetical protein
MARTTGGTGGTGGNRVDNNNTGRTGGGGATTSGGGGAGGGSAGTTDGIYSGDKVSGELQTYGYLGNNTGVPPTLTEVALADGQYYGTFTDKAVAEQNQTYFAYFNGIGGTGPEIIDQTAYFIKYIIDTKGNVVDPAPSFNTSRDQETGLFNLIDNFELGKRAVVKQIEYDPTQATYKNLSGIHTITGVGFMENIAVTEIGLKPTDYTPTMSFGPTTVIPVVVGNMSLDYRYYPPSPDPAEESWTPPASRVRIFFTPEDFISPHPIPFTTPILNPGGWEVNNFAVFTALSGSAETNTRIKFKVQIALRVDPIDDFALLSYGLSPIKYDIGIYKNGIQIGSSNNPLPLPLEEMDGYSSFTSDWLQDYQEGDWFNVRVILYYGSDKSNASEEDQQEYLDQMRPYMFAYDDISNYVQVIQETPPNTLGSSTPDPIVGINTAYAPYFTGSYNITSSYSGSGIINENASYTLLVLSSQLSSIFRYNPIQNINTASQSGIDGMSFSKCTIPFGSTQPGDFIRFEYNKNNVRLITDVGYWSDFTSGSALESLYGDEYIVWKISPPIGTTPTGSLMNLNHFNMYRIVNNGNYIILDVPRTDPNSQTGTFTSGILQPEFSSEELINNFNEIITTLTEKETIN